MSDPNRSLLLAAHALASSHHASYDPSHDIHHINRVLSLSTRIALSLNASSGQGTMVVDVLVVQLAAMFHDLLDAKYLPKGAPKPSAGERLIEFWAEHPLGEGEEGERRMRAVERVVENVSYSKEVKRIKAGEQTAWHLSCLELHCVQDADKLDAIGAFGVMRCAAYSATVNRALFDSAASAEDARSGGGGDHAVQHFHDKLFNLEGMMKTDPGRAMARQRTTFMRAFVEQVAQETSEAALPDFLR